MKRELVAVLALGGVCLIATAGASGWLAWQIAGCYLPGVPLPETPLCTSDFWGASWMPLAVCLLSFAMFLTTAWLSFDTAIQQLRNATMVERRLLAHAVAADSQVEALVDVPVVLVAVDQPLALTVGVRRPRVIVSTGLVDRLTTAELRAILVHEAEHVAARHPFLYTLVRAARNAAKLVPAAGVIADRAVLEAEMQADRAAVDAAGREVLASALLRLMEDPQDSLRDRAVAGAIGGMLAQRIEGLHGFYEHEEMPSSVRMSSAATVVLLTLPLAWLVVASVRVRG